MSPNQASLDRARELQEKTIDYLAFKSDIKRLERENDQHYEKQKQALLSWFKGTESDWHDWHWQMKHRVTDPDLLARFVSFDEQPLADIRQVAALNRFAIVPYYLALISSRDDDPIKMLSVPSIQEILDTSGDNDPMDEEHTNPAGSITRRYPDRLIINVTNICAMYCRHCQRRRLIGETDHHTPDDVVDESIAYVRDHPEIRDVLLTGGDALLLSDRQLERILAALRTIDHVEIIRIGSRTPVTMPMRITDELVNMIKKYHPVYLNTHFNHSFEVTDEAVEACRKLVDAGISVGNQAVLLRDINDTPYQMTYLNQKLLQARVRPYYIFHAKSVRGTSHLIPSLEDGLAIMEFMRGFTSGMAIPTYIMNAPGGLGKVPLLPEYIIKQDGQTYTIRTWEDRTFTYESRRHR